MTTRWSINLTPAERMARDLVVTGALGHCPLYAKLGHVPASLKGRTS